MDRRYSLEDFLKIVEALRGEQGCPWDKKQTHESLRSCIMEEAAELVSSIRIYHSTGDPENMKEELGDLLLQVVMHAQIASEEGLFTMEDIIQGISEKMIRRHPHVFGTEQKAGTEEIIAGWEEIKKKEKEGKRWVASPLREIPRELPALTRAAKVWKKADRLYQEAEDYGHVVSRLEKAVHKMKAEGMQESPQELGECIGDILWDISAVAARMGIPQEQILTDRIEDMIEEKEPFIQEGKSLR